MKVHPHNQTLLPYHTALQDDIINVESRKTDLLSDQFFSIICL